MKDEVNAFDSEKYRWRGLNPRIAKGWSFKIKPWIVKGANFREVHWLWFKITVSWLWNPKTIWNDGWDAHFRQTLPIQEAMESTKIYNRNN